MCAQSCLTLCNPVNCSPAGFSVYETVQARTLQRVAISSSRGSSRPRDLLSCVPCTGRWTLCHGATWEAPYDHCTCTVMLTVTQENRWQYCCFKMGGAGAAGWWSTKLAGDKGRSRTESDPGVWTLNPPVRLLCKGLFTKQWAFIYLCFPVTFRRAQSPDSLQWPNYKPPDLWVSSSVGLGGHYDHLSCSLHRLTKITQNRKTRHIWYFSKSPWKKYLVTLANNFFSFNSCIDQVRNIHKKHSWAHCSTAKV